MHPDFKKERFKIFKPFQTFSILLYFRIMRLNEFAGRGRKKRLAELVRSPTMDDYYFDEMKKEHQSVGEIEFIGRAETEIQGDEDGREGSTQFVT